VGERPSKAKAKRQHGDHDFLHRKYSFYFARKMRAKA
jgi:hypothetical protein